MELIGDFYPQILCTIFVTEMNCELGNPKFLGVEHYCMEEPASKISIFQPKKLRAEPARIINESYFFAANIPIKNATS
jgi:hypothetical protein